MQILETSVTLTQSETYLIEFIYSYVSGVTILGTTSEIYNYGTQYWFIAIAILLQGIAVSYIYIPVFATLQVGSSYEVSQDIKLMTHQQILYTLYYSHRFKPIYLY